MIALDNGDKIRGDAAAANEVDYLIFGFIGTIATQIADGQLPAAIGDLYTAGADGIGISSIVLVNTGAVARTVNLYLTPAAGAARRLIPKDYSLAAGYALLTDGKQFSVLPDPGAGVGTHDILDGSVHPDTVAQAATRGSIIYGNATPKWDELVIGAANRALLSDGTDPSWTQIIAAIVANTPAGGIAATDVQAAINELDTEKAPATHTAEEPFDAHLNNPCARVYRNVDQVIPNNAWTMISATHERFDTDNIWVIGNPTRLTCQTAGKYQITGHASFEQNAAGERNIGIWLNGATLISLIWVQPTAGFFTRLQTTTLYDLTATDIIEFGVFQNSGGNLDIISVGNYSPEFMMVRVG